MSAYNIPDPETWTDWPQDFCVLLADLIWEETNWGDIDSLPDLVPELRSVATYRDEVLQNWDHYDLRDFEKVRAFLDSLCNDRESIPPLIVSGDFLRDGYHRVSAMFLAGIDSWPVIDLDQIQAATTQGEIK